MYRCFRCSSTYDRHTGFCSSCWSAGTVILVGQRPVAASDGLPEVVEAGVLIRSSWRFVPVSTYSTLRCGHGAMIVIYGPSASGKSTMTARLVAGIDGPAILVSSEEGPGPGLAERLDRAGLTRPGVVVVGRATVDQVYELARVRKAQTLAVDSVQLSTYTAADLRHLLAVLPALKLLIAVSQVNKHGEIEGRNALLHEADAALHVESMHWSLVKSRYQPTPLDGPVLDVSNEVSNEQRPDLSVPVLPGSTRNPAEIRPEGPSDVDVPGLLGSHVRQERAVLERAGDPVSGDRGDRASDAGGARVFRLDAYRRGHARRPGTDSDIPS